MIKVKLRSKPITGNRHTLYLDYYPPIPHPDTGKLTRREFLKLYVFDKPKTPIEKDHNRETRALAEHIRAQRQIDVQSGRYGFLSTNKRNADFVQYFRELAAKRSGSNSDNWLSALNYLEKFTGGTLKFSDLNEHFCNEFREYLLAVPSSRSNKTTLAQNTAVSYFNKLKATLKQAFKDGLLDTDLNAKIKPIKQAETQREFLTLEELQTLAKTDCALPILKQAALFSALTGLRFGDIEKLTWREVRYSKSDGYSLHFRQEKTNGVEVLPIGEQAFKLLGPEREQGEKVFQGLKYSAHANGYLKQWILRAGITKNIGFHAFRHTYATLQLQAGTDLYTVSKMLGHKSVKITEIYAKIVDKTKREAADKINLEL